MRTVREGACITHFFSRGVGLLDEGLPACSNVGRLSMVGDVIDQYANVKVASLIGIMVVEVANGMDLATPLRA